MKDTTWIKLAMAGDSTPLSVKDIIGAAKGKVRCEFYRVCKSNTDPDIYVCYFIAAKVEVEKWDELGKLTNTQWSTKFERNAVIVNYIKENFSSPTYSVEELDERLEAHGFAKLRERRKES